MADNQADMPTGPAAEKSKEAAVASSQQRPSSTLRVVALGLFCFACSFLGVSVAVNAGLVKPATTVQEKQSIVAQEGEVVADVAERVSPSVVSILTESQATLGLRSFTQQGAGTGIVISSDGYILTNRHVAADVSKVQVVMSDGTSYDNVKVVGSDPANDIAFLKIDGIKDLAAAKIGDSASMEVGEKVIAIGNALGQYQTSVTSGIISGLGRPLIAGDQGSGESEQLNNLFQTDAAINPGNSGGPLVNLSGEVIGINTAIDQEAQGIGFAIPINDAKGLIKTVTQTGKVSRAFLGVSHVGINADIVKEYKLSVKNGAYITADEGSAVTAGSPAATAGLKAGDIITKVDGKAINASNPLLSALSIHAPGDKVSLTYVRDGKEKTITVTLGTFPSS